MFRVSLKSSNNYLNSKLIEIEKFCANNHPAVIVDFCNIYHGAISRSENIHEQRTMIDIDLKKLMWKYKDIVLIGPKFITQSCIFKD